VANTAEGVRVVIYDQEYFIRGELDPEYIQKLGSYLDAKMRSIAGRTRHVDSLRVAVLAGLNIADEHHQLKAKYQAVSEKVGACDQVLDEILRVAG
jgi:cell division protein ZapA